METLVLYLRFKVYKYVNEEPVEDSEQEIDSQHIKTIEEMVPAIGNGFNLELNTRETPIITKGIIVDLQNMWIVWEVLYKPADFKDFFHAKRYIYESYIDNVEEITGDIIPYERWVWFEGWNSNI